MSSDKSKCDKCDGSGFYSYDSNHAKPCKKCCKHDKGYWKLRKHYGKDNDKWACLSGCGHIVDNPPLQS